MQIINRTLTQAGWLTLAACVACCAGFAALAQQKGKPQTPKPAATKPAPSKDAPPAKPAPPANDEPVAITSQTPAPASPPDTVGAEQKPGPDQFGNFRYPTINNKGQIAFLGLYEAPGAPQGFGQSIFIHNPDGTWKVTQNGESVTNLKDDIAGIHNFTLSENGDLTFSAALAGKAGLPNNPNAPNMQQYLPGNQGLFVKTAEGIKVLMRLGEEVPNMPSFFSGIANPSSSSKGVTAFIGTYTDPDGRGLFVVEQGKLKLVARSGQKIGAGEERVFSEHYYPSHMNEKGEIAWFSRIGSDGGGIFVYRAGKIEAIAMQNKAAPVAYKDAAGATKYPNFIGFGNRAPSINERGDIAFAAFFDGPEHGRALFLKPVDGPLQLVARDNVTMAGTTLNFFDFMAPVVNARGDIAFIGLYGSRTPGVFLKTAKGIEAVAVRDQKFDGGKPTEMLKNFHAPELNDRGEVVFYANFGGGDVGIFRYDSKGLRALVRRGDKMPALK